MSDFTIEQIQDSDIENVAILLANAFETNPAYSAIFKDKDRLKEGLLWLFKASLLINNQKQLLTMVIKDKNSREIIGTYTLIPPQGIKKSISIYSKIGVGRFISKFGLGTLIRMLNLDEMNKNLLADSLQNAEHYYLSMVVINEKYRGKGIGSFAIRHAIDQLISSKPNCRILGLTTQLPENVTFYSRLGFTKIDEGYVYFKENKYYNYNMKFDLP